MVQTALLPLHDFRRRTGCTLAVLGAVLAVVLGGMAFGCPARVSYRLSSPLLDAGDIDAKALRPQQQLAFRGASRSIRLGSSAGTETALLAWQSARGPTAKSAPAPTPLFSGASTYLEQRTSCPRGPPLLVA
jgi:hypothetical protein